LLTGWGGLSPANYSDRVFAIESVPHDWLFPRVAAVVHHGGAGTTAAGLRAGRPTIIVPFMADQPFWGRAVARLGVGPQPIPRQRLTVERLAGAIRRVVNDTEMQTRAAELGAKLRVEDGVSTAVEALNRFVVGEALTPLGAYRPAAKRLEYAYAVRRPRTFLPQGAPEASQV
jgi:sterol 3beta-glucosyltransferase